MKFYMECSPELYCINLQNINCRLTQQTTEGDATLVKIIFIITKNLSRSFQSPPNTFLFTSSSCHLFHINRTYYWQSKNLHGWGDGSWKRKDKYRKWLIY